MSNSLSSWRQLLSVMLSGREHDALVASRTHPAGPRRACDHSPQPFVLFAIPVASAGTRGVWHGRGPVFVNADDKNGGVRRSERPNLGDGRSSPIRDSVVCADLRLRHLHAEHFGGERLPSWSTPQLLSFRTLSSPFNDGSILTSPHFWTWTRLAPSFRLLS